MKILVIGHSVLDIIHSREGLIIKPGGIYYTCLGLSFLSKVNDSFSLITSLDEENLPYFQDVYSKFDMTHIRMDLKIPRVNLYPERPGERGERYENMNAKLTIERNIDLNEYDGILINLITGFDINIEDLKFLRSRFTGKIYLDIHTLARGIDKKGGRYFRLIKDSDRWIENADFIQVNENELFTLSDKSSINEIIDEVLNFPNKTLIITKAEKGAELHSNITGEVIRELRNGIEVIPKNKVGCGDLFGAVFFYSYLREEKFSYSLEKANLVAGHFTECEDFNDVKKIKKELSEYLP